MVKNLYEHFKVLYQHILEKNPTLAAEHALKQEQEVYDKVNKLTYRNVRIVLFQSDSMALTVVAGSHIMHCID